MERLKLILEKIYAALGKGSTIIGLILGMMGGTVVSNVNSCTWRNPPPIATAPQAVPTSPTIPATPPAPAPRPWDAIGKIQIGSYGCTATLIEGRHSDGTYDAVSAAHCIPQNIRNGIMRMDNGKQFGIVVMAVDAKSDCAWLRTVGDVGVLPTCQLAESLPAPGEPVWHGGYGEHIPRNKEHGTVVNPTNGKGQTQYFLNVSSGDSGGGIICDRTGRLLSTVCCTTSRNSKADVWGCDIERIRELRPKDTVSAFEWQPVEIPQVMPEK